MLKKFHDHFEQNMKTSLRESRHTRPHDVEEITSTYEYSMRIWEDETKKIYMKQQPAEGPQTFDEVLSACTEEEDNTVGGVFMRMTPRIATAASAADRRRPLEEPPTRRVRSRGRGRGRGGGGAGKGKGRGRGPGRRSQPYNIWQGAHSPASGSNAQWYEPSTHQTPRANNRAKGDRKGKKGRGKGKDGGKSKGDAGKGTGKGVCYFWQNGEHCPRTNCPFAHSE